MAAETVSCPQCDKKLRVPEELIGKLVKCPTCGQTFNAEVTVPAKKNEADEKPDRSARVWKKDEDDPPRNSRRSPDEDDDDRPLRKSRRSRRDDDDDDERPSRRSRRDEDDDEDGLSSRLRRRDLMPHRGALILVLGILALVTGLSFILGPIAWIMGNNDMREMQAGRMDREGEGMTQGGRICGMVATILAIVSLGGGLIVLLMFYGCCCGGMGNGGANGF